CAEDDWRGRLSAWWQRSLSICLEDFRLHDLVYADHYHDRSDPDLNQVLDQVEAILRAGGEAGAWPQADWRSTAVIAFWSMHDLVYADHYHDRSDADLNHVLDQVEAILRARGEAGAWPQADWRRLAVIAFWSMHGLADDLIARGGDSEEVGRFLSQRLLAMLGGTGT